MGRRGNLVSTQQVLCPLRRSHRPGPAPSRPRPSHRLAPRARLPRWPARPGSAAGGDELAAGASGRRCATGSGLRRSCFTTTVASASSARCRRRPLRSRSLFRAFILRPGREPLARSVEPLEPKEVTGRPLHFCFRAACYPRSPHGEVPPTPRWAGPQAIGFTRWDPWAGGPGDPGCWGSETGGLKSQGQTSEG